MLIKYGAIGIIIVYDNRFTIGSPRNKLYAVAHTDVETNIPSPLNV